MSWRHGFDDSPRALRRLVLLLYALVGPVFTAVLVLGRDSASPRWTVEGVVLLVLAGAAALVLRARPSTSDWIFPAAVAPTLCCGLGVVGGGRLGMAYLGVMGAPLAWASIMFDAPVSVSAFVTATATCFGAVLYREGAATAVASTVVFSTINGLVGWVVYGLAGHLRETRALLRASADRDVNEIELVHRFDGSLVHANDRALAAYGYDRAEMLRLNVRDLREPGTRHAVEEQMASVREAGAVRFESVHARKDGSSFPVEVSARPFRAGGELLLHSLVRDLTEQRRREDQLRLVAILVAHMQEAVISIGLDLRVRSWTGAAEAMYGWTEAEALGRPVTTLVLPELAPADAAAFAARLAECGALRVVAHQRRKDGSRIVVDASTAVLRGADGAVSGYIAVVRDVTDQKVAERKLRRSEERLRLALAAGAHVAWDWDVEHDVFTHGAGWPELLGRPPGEVPDTIDGWKSVVHPDDLAPAWQALRDCVAGRAADYQAKYRVRRSSGEWRWVRSQARVTSRDASGRARRMIGTRTDITETEDLNRRLLESTRLASVGTLAAGVAHEINNPLAYVTANLDLGLALVEDPGPGDEDARNELRTLIEESRQGAGRIAAIVKAMRSLGRPDRPEAISEVDVRGELLSAVEMVRNRLTQHAHLAIDVPEDLPVVRSGTNELGRVFLNLLVNAAQAIQQGAAGEHTISVVARTQDREVIVEVADTGCGFGDEVRARMFDPFFTTKPVGQGTGLGLTIARSIVEAAGGRIEVEGRVGAGARFRVRLPAASAPAPEPSLPQPGPASPARWRVLVIDDEPMVRRSLERMLARHHEVQGVGSAPEALALVAADDRWDAVLCDLMMSGMDGVALYERLAADHPSVLPHLAFITGGVFGDRASGFLQEHAVVVLAKPVEPDALLEAVERLAAGAGPRRT